MEDFRKAMYAACRQTDLEIVPTDIGARIMAFVGLQGGDERTVMCPRLRTELEHLQELYHIRGGEWPEWLNKLIEERYGFKPYKL